MRPAVVTARYGLSDVASLMRLCSALAPCGSGNCRQPSTVGDIRPHNNGSGRPSRHQRHPYSLASIRDRPHETGMSPSICTDNPLSAYGYQKHFR